MSTEKTAARDVDEYIAGFPEDVRRILEQVRATIREAVPEAEETISYQIPTFKLNGRYLVYFAGHRKHVAVYPAPLASPEIAADLAPYASGKGTAKFPLDRPIPLDLVRGMVRVLEKENAERLRAKERKK